MVHYRFLLPAFININPNYNMIKYAYFQVFSIFGRLLNHHQSAFKQSPMADSFEKNGLLTRNHFRWQICHRNCHFYIKKAAMISSSLLLKMSVSYRNRTYNRVLGGPRYIHLTKETNAVFPGFFDPLAPAAIIYNSNTFVMNYLFLISSDFQISLP